MGVHQEILDRLRAQLGPPPTPAGAAVVTAPIGCLGCPPHLVPGTKVLDPVTGQMGEVVAYGRTREIVAPAR